MYTIVNILGSKLPWQNTSSKLYLNIKKLDCSDSKKEKLLKKEKQKHILCLKRICSPERVCQNIKDPNIAKAIIKILSSAMCLGFEEPPPYLTYESKFAQI